MAARQRTVNRTYIAEFIEAISKEADAFDTLESEVSEIGEDELGEALLHCGVIPERFRHDSSEEKLWAKYCDILLSKSFNCMGIPSEVIRVRGDSADVRGIAEEYSIVADAKAFRLSRTAKNQKDFKVTALDDWRRGDTFACLVAPLYQYPSRASQIYEQAEERNVTLLSYVHVLFLVNNASGSTLRRLWTTPQTLNPHKDARRYWEEIDDIIIALTGASYEELRRYKERQLRATDSIAKEGVMYWESVKENYYKLSRDEAIRRLIKAEKIDQKINTIHRQVEKIARSLGG